MYTDYEDIDKCLDCANTQSCDGTEKVVLHPIIEEGGHHAVIACSKFNHVLGYQEA